MEKENSLMNKAFKNYKWVTASIMSLGILIFVIVAFLMTKSVGKVVVLTLVALCSNGLLIVGLIFPLKYFISNYNGTIERMKQGDLKLFERLNEFESNKMFIKLIRSISSVLEEFVAIVKGSFETIESITRAAKTVNTHSDEAISAAEEMSRMMQQIAEGATRQAAQSQTGEALMETLSEEITLAYENCRLIMEETNKMTVANKEGHVSIVTLQERTQSANNATQEISDTILLLIEKMKDIALFVDTIENISAQTNLLALNAAIEAARAGDAGRGFGVVAEEIRKLADQSHQSTNEIKNLVANIESETSTVNEAMIKMNSVSVEEKEAVTAAMEVFEKIAMSIEGITEKISLTNDAISKVNQDKEHVSSIIENVATVTQETAAHTEEGASFAQDQVARMERVKDEISNLEYSVDALNQKIRKYNRL